MCIKCSCCVTTIVDILHPFAAEIVKKTCSPEGIKHIRTLKTQICDNLVLVPYFIPAPATLIYIQLIIFMRKNITNDLKCIARYQKGNINCRPINLSNLLVNIDSSFEQFTCIRMIDTPASLQEFTPQVISLTASANMFRKNTEGKMLAAVAVFPCMNNTPVINHLLRNEMVYLPLYKVADTPFHI